MNRPSHGSPHAISDLTHLLKSVGRRCDSHYSSGSASGEHLAMFQQGQERFSCDTGGSYQRQNDVAANFVLLGNNQGAGNARFFHFYVTALLAGLPVSKLMEYTNEFMPGQRI